MLTPQLRLTLVVLLIGCQTLFSFDMDKVQRTLPLPRIETNRYRDASLVAISVTGAVKRPGTYEVAPTLRMMDVIALANGGELPDVRSFDCRAVQVRSPDSSYTIDILAYLSSGDLRHNPHVAAGADLHVPYAIRTAHISGDVQGPLSGLVPLKAGESVGELLALFSFNATADSSAILLKHRGGQSSQLSLQQLRSLEAQDGDVVTVFARPDWQRLYLVSVSGQARRAGRYPIVAGQTTAQQILEQCGGANESGDISRAFILRRDKMQSSATEPYMERQGRVRPEIGAGLSHMATSRDYAVLPLSDGNDTLVNGDEIVIPRIESAIYLSGLVANPGAQRFEAGKSVRDYLRAGGGVGRGADRRNIAIYAPYGDAFLLKQGEPLAPGDIIVVPRAEEDKWLKRWTPMIQALATTVSLVITVATFVDR
jgi:protein involved in polysaccharide export with SLBB domain